MVNKKNVYLYICIFVGPPWGLLWLGIANSWNSRLNSQMPLKRHQSTALAPRSNLLRPHCLLPNSLLSQLCRVRPYSQGLSLYREGHVEATWKILAERNWTRLGIRQEGPSSDQLVLSEGFSLFSESLKWLPNGHKSFFFLT